ncbi:MAG: choice-of-anchor Q domain-containing protein [Kiritimatiellia bacterium]|jgi:hypothetical protein
MKALYSAIACGLMAGAALGATIPVFQGDDLAAAIAGASAGDTIEVGPGTYECTSQFVVDKAITLVSAEGPESTILRATSATASDDTKRVLLVTGAATISGFTLEQGATSINATRSGLTVYMNADNAVLTNCIVRSTGAWLGGQRVKGGGILMDKVATIVDCVVSNYYIHGAYGCGVYMTKGTLADSTISDCRVGWNDSGAWNFGALGSGVMLHGSCMATNCVVTRNTSGYYIGAGVFLAHNGAKLVDCTVTGNRTRNTSGAGVFNLMGKVIGCTISGNTMIATGLRSDYDWLNGTVTNTTSTSLLPPGADNVWTRELPATIPTRVYCAPDGAHEFPFDSPETAATNATEAIEAACAFARASGTKVRVDVAAGIYAIHACPNVTDPIDVVGAGRDVTHFLSESNISRALRVTANGASVSGLRLRGKQNVTSNGNDLTIPAINNNYGLRGNGICLEGDSVVSNCLFRGNNSGAQSRMTGGAIYASAGRVADCDISGNTGDPIGMVYLEGTSLMESCFVTNNASTWGYSPQDGIYTPGVTVAGGAEIRNCLVTGNKGLYGVAGLTLSSSAAKAYNCTVVSNISTKLNSTDGVGLTIGNGQVRNCIFAHNYAGISLANVRKNGGSIAYSMSDTTVSGTGNIVATPSFVDFDNNDFHLALGSAGIDQGNDYATITNDLDGVARPLDGDADGTPATDMGCYEFKRPDNSVTFTVANGFAIDSATATFTATVVADGVTLSDYTGVAFTWTFSCGDTTNTVGGSGNDYAQIERAFGHGCHDAALEVTLPNHTEVGYGLPGAVKVFAEEMFVACDGGSPAPAFPYATIDTAAARFDDAIAAAEEAQLAAGLTNAVFHLVGAGTFPLGRTLNASFDAKVIGEGPERTDVARAPGFGSRAMAASKNFLLQGVTLRGFAPTSAQPGGGLCVTSSHKTTVLITNCVFDACLNAGNPEAAALYVNVNSASDVDVVDCIFRNSISSNPQWRSTVYLCGADVLMDRCIVTNNCSGDAGWLGHCISGVRMAGSAIVRNCLIADNYTIQVDSASGATGPAVMADGSSVIENCTIAANRTLRDRLTTAVGLYLNGGRAVNCVVADNYDEGKSEIRDLTDANQRIAYSAVEGIGYGEGNIATHVTFKDAANRDWRLAGPSAGVGAGLNADWMLGATDLAGNPRKLGARVDMGCYEAPLVGTLFLLK